MAKSANSKVIFLPASNQTMPQNMPSLNMDLANQAGEGPSQQVSDGNHDYGMSSNGMGNAINARMVENI